MLQSVAEKLSPPNHKYLGSAAFHVYLEEGSNLLGEKSTTFCHQIQLADVGESYVQQIVEEFVKAIQRYYGHGTRSVDPNYVIEGDT